MTLPQVTITELDGALGVLPPSAGRLTAFVGCALDGPYNTPVTFGRVTDLKNTFNRGQLVEAAGYYITNTGRPCVVVRANAVVEGETGPITHVGTGTSVVTTSPTLNEPSDDYQFVLEILEGGTVGTAGIVVRGSHDGGFTWTQPQPLGTLTQITTVAGVTFELGTGTMVAGDIYTATAKGPNYDGGSLADALDGLGLSAVAWEQLVLTGPLDATTFGVVETKLAGWRQRGKYHSWLGCARMPDEDETEPEYLLALNAQFGELTTTIGGVTAGAVRLVSGVQAKNFRRPLLFALAGVQGNVSEEVNVADVNLGALRGASITDSNGNPTEHNEALYPGLDDARFITARSWDGYPGVYITRPRILSTPTSDFQIIPYRRVLNLAEAVLREYFVRRLNRPIRVDTKTGYILEADAVEIEGGARAAMRSALLAKPKASGVQFVLSRFDNVLSTKTLTGTARVLPLAYPEFIEITIGFANPAMQVATA
jgi:hypothetical protein